MVYVLCRMIKEFNEEEAATKKMEKEMTMSQDVWRTLCTKVDDLKLTNARGNKIRGTIMPPIFSMG